jgi:hypothetical protein
MNDDVAASEARMPHEPSPRAICEYALAKLCAGNTGIAFALITTRDARVVSYRAHASIDAGRLAAMTSSILAVCESLSNEFDGGGCHSVALSMREYTCVIARIPAAQHSISLAIGVRGDVLLAHARRMTLDLADRIAASLDALAIERAAGSPAPAT